jgi:hypothetical protein
LDGAAGWGKEKEGKYQDKEEERRITDGLSQGPKCNFRKLPGLVYKTKFPINLKPE